MNDKYPSRKPTRLKTYDYNSVGAYFITICTANRERILSTISDPSRVDLTDIGLIVKKRINILNDHYKNISVDHYVIMPDHIHIILSVFENNGESSKQHSQLSKFISTLKRFCNKEIGKNVWQRGSFDHVIRNREDYDAHVKYIHDNPEKWYYEGREPEIT